VTQIFLPDSAYLGATTYLDPSGLTTYTNYGSITDGVQTITWNGVQNKRVAPGGGWATWNDAPDSQRSTSGTLPVFYSNGATSLTITLSLPVQIFGFEAEPDPFDSHRMTAQFYSGSTLLGSSTRSVVGDAGSLLFAASTTGSIDKVVFSSDVAFATGAYRYGTATPEPGTFALLGAALGGLALLRRRK
jgi:hypothetical protein